MCECVFVRIYVHTHTACFLMSFTAASPDSADMYPPPHMTHVSSSSYDTCIFLLMQRQTLLDAQERDAANYNLVEPHRAQNPNQVCVGVFLSECECVCTCICVYV
jgi:hypothetical protein